MSGDARSIEAQQLCTRVLEHTPASHSPSHLFEKLTEASEQAEPFSRDCAALKWQKQIGKCKHGKPKAERTAVVVSLLIMILKLN
jgi:hypothetical protein